jgi:hypothetical protein
LRLDWTAPNARGSPIDHYLIEAKGIKGKWHAIASEDPESDYCGKTNAEFCELSYDILMKAPFKLK